MAWRGLRSVALLATVLGVVAAGCGQPGLVDLRSRPVALSIGEFQVRPQRVIVSSGELKLAVRNTGRLAHQLAVGQSQDILQRTDWIKPGQSAVISMHVTRGLYRVFDPTGNNDAAGLSGSIEVR